MNEFWTGDIFAVKGSGPSGWASKNLLLPKTDRTTMAYWATTSGQERELWASRVKRAGAW
ncbi:MAG: hypothetical protein JRE40_16195 [Deltaproteobacteria bacterium]|nr:hypothetical protein [Deltaproteobacteria bacterium]